MPSDSLRLNQENKQKCKVNASVKLISDWGWQLDEFATKKPTVKEKPELSWVLPVGKCWMGPDTVKKRGC